MNGLSKLLITLAIIVITPIILFVAYWFFVVLAVIVGLPIMSSKHDAWAKTPHYVKMSNATFRIDPKYKHTSHVKRGGNRAHRGATRAYVPLTPDQSGTPFRLTSTAKTFGIRCWKDRSCFPHLKEYEKLNFKVSYTEDEIKIRSETPLERTKSFNSDFDYSQNPISINWDLEYEFSLISKDPLYFDSYAVVSCGHYKSSETPAKTLTCDFESIRTSESSISNTSKPMPMVKFRLKPLETHSLELQGHRPDLWPEIIKGFEQFLSDIQVPSDEVERIETLAEGYWKKNWDY